MLPVLLTGRMAGWWRPERLNIRLRWFPPGSLNAHLLAAGLVAAGLSVGIAMPEWVKGTHFITLFPAVMMASLLCGVQVGTFAIFLSAIVAAYFLIPPYYSISVAEPGDIAGLLGFVLVAEAMVLLIGALRTALDRAEIAKSALTALFEANPDAVLVVSDDGRIDAVNERALEYFELSRDDMVGLPLSKIFMAPDGSDLMQPGSPWIGATRVARGRRRNGRPFPIAVRFRSFPRGKERAGIVTVRDLTEERAALEALATYALPDALFIHDQDGNLIQINARACETTGYSQGELLAMKLADVQEDFDPVAARAAWERLEIGVRQTYYSHHRRKDGSKFPVEISLGLMETTRRRLYVAVARDISEREAAEECIRQLQKREVLGQLAGGVAHDFNNILAAIVTNLELLQMQTGLSPMARQLQENALAAAVAGASLPQQLLLLTRRQVLQVEHLDINAIVSGMADLLRRTLGAAIEVDVRLDRNAWPVSTDRGRLENVLLNLAVNARDAMPHGGTLIVETRNLTISRGMARRDQPPAGDYVKLSVTDTGIGMTPEVLRRAREPFFTTKPPGGGTGLGLSMAESFAQEANGYLSIESWPGKGTAVSLLLPRTHGTVPERIDNVPAPAVARRPATILVVEDIEELRKATCAAIEMLGYHVLQASSAAEALTMVEQRPDLDLVFTDISMPGGRQGDELAREIRAKHPRIKIVLTSGNLDPQAIDADLASKFTMIAKPYRISDIAKILTTALPM